MTAVRRAAVDDGIPIGPSVSGQPRLLDKPVWEFLGQAGIVAFVVFGFGAIALSPLKYAALLVIPVIGCLALAPRGTNRHIRVSLSLLVFVTYWMMTYLWSTRTYFWFISTAETMVAVGAVVALASVLSARATMRAFLAGCYAVIGMQLFALITSPRAAMVSLDGLPGWRGSFIHKNAMAPFLVLAVMTILLFERRRRWKVASIAVALVFIVMSQSATGLTTLIVVLAGYAWLRMYVDQPRRVATALAVASSVAFGALLFLLAAVLPSFLTFYGKDATLSGRTDIWTAVWRATLDQPFTGYGIGVWWDPSRPPVLEIIQSLGFSVLHSHNTIIEMLFLFGFIGLALFLPVFGLMMVGGWKELRRAPRIGTWVILVGVTAISISFTEVAFAGPWLGLFALGQTLTMNPSSRRPDALARGRTARRPLGSRIEASAGHAPDADVGGH